MNSKDSKSNRLFKGEYQCTRFGCIWADYDNKTDWGYYYEDTGNILSIDKCSLRCSDDSNCGAFEWNHKYCSWWKKGVCKTKVDSTINDTVFWMCRKQGKKERFDIQDIRYLELLIFTELIK